VGLRALVAHLSTSGARVEASVDRSIRVLNGRPPQSERPYTFHPLILTATVHPKRSQPLSAASPHLSSSFRSPNCPRPFCMLITSKSANLSSSQILGETTLVFNLELNHRWNHQQPSQLANGQSRGATPSCAQNARQVRASALNDHNPIPDLCSLISNH
jgi:hypothetical protein